MTLHNLTTTHYCHFNAVVDEDRSCFVTASKTPVYISGPPKLCGTESQPWILEAPIGQQINISLFDFTTSNSDWNQGKDKQSCQCRGLIYDKAGKRNASICLIGERRQRTLYLSAGNAVKVVFEASQQENIDNKAQFMLSVQGQCLKIHYTLYK